LVLGPLVFGPLVFGPLVFGPLVIRPLVIRRRYDGRQRRAVIDALVTTAGRWGFLPPGSDPG